MGDFPSTRLFLKEGKEIPLESLKRMVKRISESIKQKIQPGYGEDFIEQNGGS